MGHILVRPIRSKVAVGLWLLLLTAGTAAGAQTIQQAVFGEGNQRTPEISTEELRGLLTDGSVTVLDARPFQEYAVSHIPGAKNVAPKPGAQMSMYVSDVAEIGRILSGNKAAALVLYCNGPFCGKSKRLSEELLAAGFTNVRRYQLGMPVWRALGGICQIEAAGLRHVVGHDNTAVVIDIRDAGEFAKGTLAGARNIPRSLVLEGKDVGEIKKAKDDGRLPMEDHNTRLIVISDRVDDARYVAQALVREAFHNVTFFPGTVDDARAALR